MLGLLRCAKFLKLIGDILKSSECVSKLLLSLVLILLHLFSSNLHRLDHAEYVIVLVSGGSPLEKTCSGKRL